MKWVITKKEIKNIEQYNKTIVRIFFNVYADDETEFFFSGDALLSEPATGFTELENTSDEDMIKLLLSSIGESAVAFYEKNATMCKLNKKTQ